MPVHSFLALILVLTLGTLPVSAVDTGTGDTLADVRELIDAENWTMALSIAKPIAAARPNDADALNLLAYILRQTGDFKNAEGFYLKALDISPRHLGANEYLGELYVETGRLDEALERLAMVEAICGRTCEEYLELKAAIDGAR